MTTTGPAAPPGGASTSFSADTAAMRTAAGSLDDTAATLLGARRYGPIAGAGEARAVEDAASRLRSTWQAPLDAWSASLRSMGAAVGSAASLIENSETAAVRRWQSGGPVATP